MKALTPEFAAFLAQRNSIIKQTIEQREYEARQKGLIYVHSQGKAMTQAEYNDWYYNVDAE